MHVFNRPLHAVTPRMMIENAHQKYDQEKKLHHSKVSVNHSFAVRLMHKIIEHAVILVFVLKASVFYCLRYLVPMADVIFWLCHKFIKHVVHVVTCCRLMAVRVAVVRRVDNAVVRMDIIIRVVDRAEKVWIEGGIGMGEG